MPYCCFAVYQHEEQCMRRPIRSEQPDLFSVPATPPLLLPAEMRATLVSLVGALLLDAIGQQRTEIIETAKEPDHE